MQFHSVTKAAIVTLVLFFALIAVLLVLVGDVDVDSESVNPVTEGERLRAERSVAKSMCEEFINDRLKSPASAKFAGSYPTYGTGEIWTWEAYVDAQNSFGAQIRTDFVCRVKRQAPNSDTWVLENLTLQNR